MRGEKTWHGLGGEMSWSFWHEIFVLVWWGDQWWFRKMWKNDHYRSWCAHITLLYYPAKATLLTGLWDYRRAAGLFDSISVQSWNHGISCDSLSKMHMWQRGSRLSAFFNKSSVCQLAKQSWRSCRGFSWALQVLPWRHELIKAWSQRGRPAPRERHQRKTFSFGNVIFIQDSKKEKPSTTLSSRSSEVRKMLRSAIPLSTSLYMIGLWPWNMMRRIVVAWTMFTCAKLQTHAMTTSSAPSSRVAMCGSMLPSGWTRSV